MKKQENLGLYNIEKEIDCVEVDLGDGLFSKDRSGYIKDLFLKKQETLARKEENMC